MRRATTTAAIAIAALLLTMTSTTSAHAQVPPSGGPPPITNGTILWQFAQEPPVFDVRIAMALNTLMTPRIAQAWPAGPAIVQVSQDGAGLSPVLVLAATEVPKLLAAAGYASTPPFVEVGQCRVWASTPDVPSKVPAIIGGALHDALASLGVQTQQCASTSDPAQATVVVWIAGSTAPALTMRRNATFLGSSGTPPMPVAPAPNSIPGGTGGNSAPRPAVTGTGGLARDVADVRVHALAALFLGVLVAGGRLRTRREARA